MDNQEFIFTSATQTSIVIPELDVQDGSGIGGTFTCVLLNDDVIVDQNGVRVDNTIPTQRTPGAEAFTYAAYRGDIGEVKRLLKEYGPGLVHATNANGVTGLMWAATKGHIEVAEFLLQNGADKERKDPDGNSSIDRARIDYQSEMIMFLCMWEPPVVKAPEIKQVFEQHAARPVAGIEANIQMLKQKKQGSVFKNKPAC